MHFGHETHRAAALPKLEPQPAAARLAGSRSLAARHRSRWVGRLGWLGCLLSFCLAVQADALPEATNLWTFSFDRGPMSDDSSSTPAVGPDGTIYAGDFFGRLFAIAPGGSEQWRFNVGREIKSSPAVSDDGTIYFGARDHWLYALTPAGKLKWKFASGGWVDSSPAVAADGTVYFGSWDKNFYALHPDGSLKWKFAAGGIVDSSPAIAADGTVYFGAHNKKFYALDAGGKPRWTFLTGAEITSSPALGVDGSIYFSSTDGQLYRLKADGTEQWRCRIGGGSDGSPVLEENGNVVIAAAYKTLVISPAGATTWTNESPRWIDETPLVLQDSVCFSAPWKQIYAIRPDGAAFWAAQTWETPSSSLVLGNGGEIYVSCYVHLQAFQPPMALLPAKSSWPMFRANPRHNGRVGAN